MNMMRGTLSRLLLPFDNNTSVADQSESLSLSSSSIVSENDNNNEKRFAEVDGAIGKEKRMTMVRNAVLLRKLVRVKIADDADLDQAKKAIESVVTFFKLLGRHARRQGEDSEWNILKEL